MWRGIACAALILAGLASAKAQGEGSWWSRQHNGNGQWCCNGADGHRYDGAYTLMPDGSLMIPAPNGGTITIPAPKVLPYNPADPNPTGQAAIWYNGQLTAGYDTNIYCFALGPLV